MTSEPGASRWFRGRLLVDRAVAALIALATAPVVAVLAALVRRDSPGPGLIRVPRVGRGGATFGMWKIRSMRADGPGGRASGLALTGGTDDRITPIGRTMRSLHLDEIPQLYNVVRGEMSLLGPRPEAPEFVDLDDPAWREVLSVPPGMLGATQLIVADWERELIDAAADGSAYATEVVPVKLALDRWYLGASSLRLDLVVIAALAQKLAGRGTSTALLSLVRRGVPEAEVPLSWMKARTATTG